MIDIDLYDYKKDQNCNGLLFNGNASERYNAWIGSWGVGYATGNDSYAVQGIVENQLYKEDGSPLTELESVEGNIQGYPKLTVVFQEYLERKRFILICSLSSSHFLLNAKFTIIGC